MSATNWTIARVWSWLGSQQGRPYSNGQNVFRHHVYRHRTFDAYKLVAATCSNECKNHQNTRNVEHIDEIFSKTIHTPLQRLNGSKCEYKIYATWCDTLFSDLQCLRTGYWMPQPKRGREIVNGLWASSMCVRARLFSLRIRCWLLKEGNGSLVLDEKNILTQNEACVLCGDGGDDDGGGTQIRTHFNDWRYGTRLLRMFYFSSAVALSWTKIIREVERKMCYENRREGK